MLPEARESALNCAPTTREGCRLRSFFVFSGLLFDLSGLATYRTVQDGLPSSPPPQGVSGSFRWSTRIILDSLNDLPATPPGTIGAGYQIVTNLEDGDSRSAIEHSTARKDQSGKDGTSFSGDPNSHIEIPSADQAADLRERAPELYQLLIEGARAKMDTENYLRRAPYEIPEKLARSGRPWAFAALIAILLFCGYIATLGSPGLVIAGIIAALDLVTVMTIFIKVGGLGAKGKRPRGRK